MNVDNEQYHASECMLPRRELLKRLVGGIAVGSLIPGVINAAKSADSQEESYWVDIKQQFPLKPGYIMMNAANLCPTHDAVLKQLFGLTEDRESDVSFHNRGKFRETKNQSRKLLADFLSVDIDEVAITRNTSEGNNIIIAGLELGPGDEVVIWDQNHPSNNLAWKTRAKRYGFSVKELETPVEPESSTQLKDAFLSQFSSNTKVFAASHVSNTTGIGLPVQEICEYCSENGIKTLIDGAQSFGAIQLDLHEMGCDYFTGSMHKWPMGPKESGLLYVRKGEANKVWPSIVTFGFDNIDPGSAAKFDNLGQLDDAIVASVATAIEFLMNIGTENIENRLYDITDALKRGIKEIPGSYLLTPEDHNMSAGVVIFSLKGVNGREGFDTLYKKYQVAAAPASSIDNGIRLSPHIYNTMDDVDKVISALKQISV